MAYGAGHNNIQFNLQVHESVHNSISIYVSIFHWFTFHTTRTIDRMKVKLAFKKIWNLPIKLTKGVLSPEIFHLRVIWAMIDINK